MFLLTIAVLANFIIVESCSSSSEPAKINIKSEPICPEYKYQEYKNHTNLLSILPDDQKIKELSLTGTHQSMTYSVDLNLRKQELTLAQQLAYGVRVFDIRVRVSIHFIDIYYRGIFLNNTLVDMMYEFGKFLNLHPKEFVFLMINYDHDENNYLNNVQNSCNILKSYQKYITGRLFVDDWSFDDTIDQYRGKILLMTTDIVFKSCTKFLPFVCLMSNNLVVDINTTDTISNFDVKWKQYVSMLENEHVKDNSCFIYNMSVEDKDINSRELAKYGGYYDNYLHKCMEPMNFKIEKQFSQAHFKNMTIMMVDYVTPKIIYDLNEFNHRVKPF